MPQKSFGGLLVNELRERTALRSSPSVQLDRKMAVINGELTENSSNLAPTDVRDKQKDGSGGFPFSLWADTFRTPSGQSLSVYALSTCFAFGTPCASYRWLPTRRERTPTVPARSYGLKVSRRSWHRHCQTGQTISHPKELGLIPTTQGGKGLMNRAIYTETSEAHLHAQTNYTHL
jgi:hypothetical protein